MGRLMDVEQIHDQGFQLFLNEIAQKVTKKVPEGLEKWQLAAWKKLLAMGLPTKDHEAFRYVRFKELYARSYKYAEKNEELNINLSLESRYRVIFVDGQLDFALSSLPKGCLLLPLSRAFSTFGPLLHGHFEKWIEREKNPFVQLNLASCEGAFLYVPPKLHIESPLQILHIHTNNQSDKTQYFPTRLHLFMGKESSLDLIETSQGDEASLFENSLLDLVLEEGASLKIRMLSSQNSLQTWSHFAMRAHLKRDSNSTPPHSIKVGS